MQTELQPRMKTRFVYRDTLVIHGDEQLLVPTIEEYITGIGLVRSIKKSNVETHIEFEFEAMSDEANDLWTICERAHEIALYLHSWGLPYIIDRSNVKRRKIT